MGARNTSGIRQQTVKTVAGVSPGRKRAASSLNHRRRAGEELPSAADLLAWYDRHRRDLPWRVRPGERSDPYRVWLSEVMLQQTTVTAAAPYFVRFIARWGEVHSLAAAPLQEVLRLWAGLGYYARARNLHACARAVVEDHGGNFPREQTALAELPGIGRYTAAAIAAIAYDAPTVPVDGNIERVVARLFAVEQTLPAAKPLIWTKAQTLAPACRSGDFAQALMDLGATICTPKRPACDHCPWTKCCAAHGGGDPERFPVKVSKRQGGLRRGAAFVALRADGCVLVRSRPEQGLLGGMTEVPTSAWTEEFDHQTAITQAPSFGRVRARWHRLPVVVRHVFTHFPLDLFIYSTTVPDRAKAPRGMRWIRVSDIPGEAFPSLMRKVLAQVIESQKMKTK